MGSIEPRRYLLKLKRREERWPDNSALFLRPGIRILNKRQNLGFHPLLVCGNHSDGWGSTY